MSASVAVTLTSLTRSAISISATSPGVRVPSTGSLIVSLSVADRALQPRHRLAWWRDFEVLGVEFVVPRRGGDGSQSGAASGPAYQPLLVSGEVHVGRGVGVGVAVGADCLGLFPCRVGEGPDGAGAAHLDECILSPHRIAGEVELVVGDE